METKQFKAESKRLLEMMIHSIYTHKEIFLRELISNASDAIDKLYFKSLTDDKVGLNKDDFAIWITADKDSRTLKIADNGIGMTAEELENNLGTIANSGSFKFKNENKLEDDNQIIGQVVEEDVGFGPENLGVPTEEIWQRVEESLKAVGMYEFRKYSPNKLSGGQKQRVSIAGVIAMHPKCIILDEPTAMLDPNGRKEVIRAVRALNDVEEITVILITHYMEEIIHADRAIVMDEGKIAMEGTPREIFSQVEKLKSLRLDVPQVTLLAHELKQNGVPLPDGILTTEELVTALGY